MTVMERSGVVAFRTAYKIPLLRLSKALYLIICSEVISLWALWLTGKNSIKTSVYRL